jgi:hypothetical protein
MGVQPVIQYVVLIHIHCVRSGSACGHIGDAAFASCITHRERVFFIGNRTRANGY